MKTLLLIFWLSAAASPIREADQGLQPLHGNAAEMSYVRVKYAAGRQPEALQTALVRFASSASDGGWVDLVSVVHVGDAEYYAALNRAFTHYDAVLYELIAPEDTVVPVGGAENGSWLSMFQGGLKDLLGLSFQMEHIDYTRKQMVHADMTPDEFNHSMSARNESLLGMLFKVWITALRNPQAAGAVNEVSLMQVLFADDRQLALRRLMAEQLSQVDLLQQALQGEEGSTILTERNKKALQVLRAQAPFKDKRIAIFYGAAHMPDLAERLQRDFGLQATGVQWLNAWPLDR